MWYGGNRCHLVRPGTVAEGSPHPRLPPRDQTVEPVPPSAWVGRGPPEDWGCAPPLVAPVCTRAIDLGADEDPGAPPRTGGQGPYPRYVLVGEAPGEAEAATRRPFMGPAGHVLTAVLAHVGLSRRDVFITNAVKIRPTIGTNLIRNRAPRPNEQAASYSYLMDELAVFDRGEPVICLGNVALRMVQAGMFGRAYISHWHGRGWYDADRMFWAMYHPAVAVYDEGMLPVLLEDMALIDSQIGLS